MICVLVAGILVIRVKNDLLVRLVARSILSVHHKMHLE